MKTNIKLLITAAVAFALASCAAPKNIIYFQDSAENNVNKIETSRPIRFKPGDKLSIIVGSRDPQVSALFNLSNSMNSTGYSASNQPVLGYYVDAEGEIDFPIVGKIKVLGLTRSEVSELIKGILMDRDFVKEPTVTVQYLNFSVSVLGEVRSPGHYAIDKDDYTIMDAISAAGDLLITGCREDIRVIRSENGVRTTYVVNMLSSEDIAKSEVYYLQQNDIVIVNANDKKLRESTVNGNTLLQVSFWVSLTSALISVANLIVNLSR